MAIVWDEPKRETNFARHGFDFADFDACFDGETALYLPAKPSRTGRTRYLVIGEWNGVTVVAAIVSLLGSQALSIVSLRTASPKERQAYERYRSQT